MLNDKRGTYVPFAKVLVDTVVKSGEVIARKAVGQLSLAQAEELIHTWTRNIFVAGRCHVDVFGREHVERGRAYVFMSNHRSLLDVPSMFSAVPGPVRMVSKRELGEVPLWGRAMKDMGFIFIDRKNRAQAIAELQAARRWLAQGVSVWIAPEGTRSRDGSLLPFKKGGFHIAKDFAVPILPVWIEGTADVLRPDTFAVAMDGHVVVRFGAPIDVEGKDIEQLMAEVRSAMEALRDG